MSRVHAVTALVALGVHLLVVAPFLRRDRQPSASAPRAAVELPVEVAPPPAPAERQPRRAKRVRTQASTPAPKPAAVALPAKQALPTTSPQSPAPAVPAAASPKAPHSPPREPLAFVALANHALVGESSTGALLIHSAALRESALGADLAKQLRSHATLSALFNRQLDPLRDCDQLLLARSKENEIGLLLVQYNAVRYKVRVAASESGSDYALPIRELLAVGESAQAFAASVAKDFRLPEGSDDEALSAYAKPPQALTLSALPHPARWLTLHVLEDGSGRLLSRAADNTDANLGRTPVAKSELKSLTAELLAAFAQSRPAATRATTD